MQMIAVCTNGWMIWRCVCSEWACVIGKKNIGVEIGGAHGGKKETEREEREAE